MGKISWVWNTKFYKLLIEDVLYSKNILTKTCLQPPLRHDPQIFHKGILLYKHYFYHDHLFNVTDRQFVLFYDLLKVTCWKVLGKFWNSLSLLLFALYNTFLQK